MKFNIILATDDKNGIGKDNSLAWKLSSDMKYFRNITSKTIDGSKNNAVIMGRKTWESIPEKYRPLPNRLNCILTRNINSNYLLNNNDNILYFEGLDKCLSNLEGKGNIETIFIIGGANVYNQVLDNPMLNKIYITKVKGDFDCDVFFEGIPNDFSLVSESEFDKENGIEFQFSIYEKNKIN